MKEAWIYVRSQHLFTRKQEKFFKDTMKFTPKQCNRHQSQRNGGCKQDWASKVGHRLSKSWQQWMQRALPGNSCSHYPKDGPASQAGGKTHTFILRERVFLSHLGDCRAKCQQNITFFLPTPSWRSSHANEVLQIIKWKDLILNIKMKRNLRAM